MIIENLLSAFYLEGGGSFVWSQDPADGYGTAMHMEPRYSVGAGFSFDATDHIEVDMGARYTAMPPLPGHPGDPKDTSKALYLEVRIRPFRKD